MKQYHEIPTYEECLNIVKECSAFSHSTQMVDGQTVESFKYNVVIPNMWEGFGRLNMRGITFVNQKMVALAFPKFFNLGENESTTNVDFNDIRCIFEKVDGSLISVFEINGKLEVKSMKSVESDVAIEARAYFKVRNDISEFCKNLLDKGYSPIFEYVSPSCRIVLEYNEPNLIYLGCRNMTNGDILLSHEPPVNKPKQIQTPQTFTVEQFKDYLKRDDVEGVVVVLNSGLMFKMKTETYCLIHKVLDHFSPKKVVDNIVNGTYDDMIGVLTYHSLENEVNKAKDVYSKYATIFEAWKAKAESYYENNKERSRKEVALDVLSKDKFLGNLVFKRWDNKDYSDSINKFILEQSKEWIFG